MARACAPTRTSHEGVPSRTAGMASPPRRATAHPWWMRWCRGRARCFCTWTGNSSRQRTSSPPPSPAETWAGWPPGVRTGHAPAGPGDARDDGQPYQGPDPSGMSYAVAFLAEDSRILARLRLPAGTASTSTPPRTRRFWRRWPRWSQLTWAASSTTGTPRGQYDGSPYDAFLKLNALPRKPATGESALDYARRLRTAVESLNPAAVGDALHGQLHPSRPALCLRADGAPGPGGVSGRAAGSLPAAGARGRRRRQLSGLPPAPGLHGPSLPQHRRGPA